MEINSKFNIYDLVQRKFETESKEMSVAYEIMEVVTQSCYAGTQIFYQCAPLFAIKQYKDAWRKDGEFSIHIAHGIPKQSNETSWQKYREDELIDLTEPMKELFKNPNL